MKLEMLIAVISVAFFGNSAFAEEMRSEATAGPSSDGLFDEFEAPGGRVLEADVQDILISHTSHRLMWWGWHRFSPMIEPGWELYQNSLSWLTKRATPQETDVILFTYNGDVEEDSDDPDGFAA